MAYVNSAEVHDAPNSGTTTISLPATSLTAGNLIVIGVSTFRFFAAAPTVTSITDDASNTYVQIGTGVTDPVNGFNGLYFWYCKNCSGHATNVVTVNLSNGSNTTSVLSAQYSGMDLSSPLDATDFSSENPANTSHTSGAFTTATANELLLGLVNTQGNSLGSFTAGSGYTIRQVSEAIALEDQSVGSIQTGATADISGTNCRWLMIVATFKFAAASPFTEVIGDTVTFSDSQQYFLNKGVQLSDSVSYTELWEYSFTVPTVQILTAAIGYSFRLTATPTATRTLTCNIYYTLTLSATPTRTAALTCIINYELTFFIIAPSNSSPISCIAATDVPPTENPTTGGSSENYGYMT